MNLKIVADRNIPYLSEAISPLGEVIMLPGDAITAEIVRDADIILTRTRTRCDSSLLDGSRCSFIGTATIGTDHIDLDYCRSRGITVANAPGCNAPAVAQYVLSAIIHALRPGETLADKCLGIIGVGNVGSILNRWAGSLGIRTLLNDPPKEQAGDSSHSYVSLDEIAAKCDVISIHTPYTISGLHATHHLIGSEFISKLSRKPLVINAARGGVTDTTALRQALADGTVSAVAIDCWENEPDIDMELLSAAAVATPHIAGYSLEGKIRATSMVLEALAAHLQSHFGLDIKPSDLTAGLPEVKAIPDSVTATGVAYDIEADHILRHLPVDKSGVRDIFESLRNNYKLRNEPH